VDYVKYWTERAELPAWQLVLWLGITLSKFHTWKRRYGKVNAHNGQIPRDFWLEPWEREAIVTYHDKHPLEGYRRLTFMMLDDDIVAVSPATTYRILKDAGRLDRNRWAPSKKGSGFVQPDAPHRHWHVDVSHLNLGGTFYFLITALDGYSRYIVHWEIREHSKEIDIELVLQRALEKCPGAKPRIVSDNGPQFIANDFKSFIRLQGLTHVRTSPYYPQSNGKLERWHGSVKKECIRPACPENLDEARRKVEAYVLHYNHARLHSAIGYVTPADKLNGLAAEIHAERDRKLEEARARRQATRSKQENVA
jgi:putative transposase